jgi:oleate hydratase
MPKGPVPGGAGNFAFLVQFTESPAMSCSPWSARCAARCTVLGIDRPVPAIYSGVADPRVAITAPKTALA